MEAATTNALATQLLLNLQRQPQHPALIFRGQTLLNRHLLYKAYRLIIALRGFGIKRGDRVGVLMEQSPELVVALLAIWHCGAVYVPLDPAATPAKQLQLATMAGLRFVVTQEGRVEQAEALPCTLLIVRPVTVEDLGIPTPRDLLDTGARKLAVTAPACIFFTADDDGEAELLDLGVVLSHGNLNNLFGSIAAILQLESNWRYLGHTSAACDSSLFELVAPLLCQGTLVIADAQQAGDPQALLTLMQQQAVDVIQALPAQWEKLNRYDWAPEFRPALLISAGAPLSKTLAADLHARAQHLWNVYGHTECTLWTTAHEVEAEDLTAEAPPLVSIGKVLPGYAAQLAGSGELLIGGYGVCNGYLDATLTAARFIQDRDGTPYFRPPDHCMLDSNGNLHVLPPAAAEDRASDLAHSTQYPMVRHPAAVTPAPALAELSNEVAAIFCEVLEVPSIGPDDNFFEVGGNSMLSAALVLTLNQRFSSNISLRKALATPPTVNSLTSLLQQAGVAGAGARGA